MSIEGILSLQTVEGAGLRFGARYSSGHEAVFDSGEGVAAPSPVESLLGSLAACEAMDVISILRKKRHHVIAYEVVMSGERAESPPRRFVSIELLHRVTGRGIPASAVEEAVRLSESKYCSVHFTLDPQLPVRSRWEVIEG